VPYREQPKIYLYMWVYSPDMYAPVPPNSWWGLGWLPIEIACIRANGVHRNTLFYGFRQSMTPVAFEPLNGDEFWWALGCKEWMA